MKRIHRIFIIWAWALPLLVSGQDLAHYQRIAAQNNPGLQAQYKAFEAALAKVAQQSSLPDPQLSFGYFLSPVETRVGPQQARFSLSQLFPWFGTLKAREKAAALRAEARYQAFLAAQSQLNYRVAQAYYPLYELHRHLKIEKENLRLLKTYKTLANSRFESGKGSMVAVLRVDMQLKEAQTRQSTLKQKKAPLLSQFNHLLNRPEGTPVALPDSLGLGLLPQNHPSDSLLSGHPLLAELRLQQKASQAQEQAAVRQGLPQMGLGVDYALVAPRGDASVPGNGQDILMPMLSLQLPIFRKKHQAAQREAHIKAAQYRLLRKEQANSLRQSYAQVRYKCQQQTERVQLREAQIQSAEQALRLLLAAYRQGENDLETVLDMQKKIWAFKKQRTSALVEYHLARAEWAYLMTKSNQSENE
ncbi:MAG: TolC family protein [Schleiferiaceae bacterium]|nr:TolC family protein [Schleiferiaceae bacterium]MDR9442601.1 TolC family protein [Schleiferiaceae bacterium]